MKKRVKPTVRTFSVRYGGYPIEVIVAIGTTPEETESAVAKRGGRITEDNFYWLTETRDVGGTGFKVSQRQYLLWMRDWRQGDIDSQQLLVHEVFHQAVMMLRDAGVKLSVASEEMFAYAIDDLYGKILAKLVTGMKK